MSESEAREGAASGAALDGPAADFVAGLSRKVLELRGLLDALGDAQDRDRGRDELRRKLHALGVGARMLQFDALSRAIQEVTDRIDEESSRNAASDELLDAISALLIKIPELALAGAPAPQRPSDSEPLPHVPPPTTPFTILVVGPEPVGNGLGADQEQLPCDIERIETVDGALERARAIAPEAILVDVDLPKSIELVEALVEDPLTMPVPIVAIGGLAEGSSTARLVAVGVTRVVAKSAPPDELRSILAELLGDAQAQAKAALHPELGVLTAQELADRIADEVRKSIVSEIDPSARGVRVDLGVGAEILGPVWGALARVRDVVEARSRGAVRFRGERRGAVAVASAIAFDREEERAHANAHVEAAPGSERRLSRRAPVIESDLTSRIIVVADDDPQVVSFIADVLKGAQAIVLEAHDGQEALALMRGSGADCVVTDVLMPRVDGLTLARNLRRDVALRDRPVILLSWKEDLLKRLRDLRMESQAMLRKEADGRTVLARVREVLAPRMRVEARIATSGEVRGRLDDLSLASLLEIVNRVRGSAAIGIRDAANVFDLELDDGGIRALVRTGVDGARVSGKDVFPSLLGVVGGRFVVRPIGERNEKERTLTGSLVDQLAPVLRRIRAACDAISGSRTVDVHAVGLDPKLLEPYLRATPPPVRTLLDRIAAGASPRELLLGGEVAPATLEDVLLDVASRGIVVRATNERGDDLLALADQALDGPIAPLVQEKKPPATIDIALETSTPGEVAKKKSSKEEESPHPSSLTDAVLQASQGEGKGSEKQIVDASSLKPRASVSRSDPPEPDRKGDDDEWKKFVERDRPSAKSKARDEDERPKAKERGSDRPRERDDRDDDRRDRLARRRLDDDDVDETYDDRPRRRRRRYEEDDDDRLELRRSSRAVPREDPRARAQKQLRSDAAFWWIIIAIGVVGLSVMFYLQNRDEKRAQQPTPAASSSVPAPTTPPPSAPPSPPASHP